MKCYPSDIVYIILRVYLLQTTLDREYFKEGENFGEVLISEVVQFHLDQQ